jgi:hypothetical protein
MALLIALAASACESPSSVSYIPEGGSYTADDLAAALGAADPGSTSRVASDAAAETRQEALADIRSNGAEASALADMLTSEFPPDALAVPFRVERGEFDGEDAWIVLEAWGEPGASLSGRRLWVISASDLRVLAAHSSR